jgi:hypothetical protein
MLEAVRCKICPVCNGTKVADPANRLPGARQEFECHNCRGEGIVPLLTCQGCGRPAMHWDAKIPYCGRKDCWEKLVEVVDLAKVRTRISIPFGSRMGFGGRRKSLTSVANARNVMGAYWNPWRGEFQSQPVPQSMLDAERLTPEETARFEVACNEFMC